MAQGKRSYSEQGTQRLVSLCLACSITVLFLLIFSTSQKIKLGDQNQESSQLILNIFPVPPHVQQQAVLSAIVKAKRNSSVTPSTYSPQAITEMPSAAIPTTVSSETHDENTPSVNTTSNLVIDSKAIARAYRDSKTDMQKMAQAVGKSVDPLEIDPHIELDRKIEHAHVPDCLHPDALKNDPPHLGPIGLSGILVLPFWAHAAITGKCK